MCRRMCKDMAVQGSETHMAESTAGIIDAHHHLWRYDQVEYSWITPELAVLQQDYLLPELDRAVMLSGVTGTVVVQARQTLAESEWLLALAGQTSTIQGVVGWAPLTSPTLRQSLASLRGCGKLKGLRHVIQDEPDDRFILRPDFNAGIASLLDTGLVYDILIHERHLPQAAAFVGQHPGQVFVLDHLAKPGVREASPTRREAWYADLCRLAEHPNVYCKLSGLVTEADWQHWTDAEVLPYLDCALKAFGPDRLMAGSDWPVCLLASSYARWWSLLDAWATSQGPATRAAIMGATATSVYRLGEASV